LRLNIHVAGGGSARVALLGENGEELPYFTAEDCEVIQDDAVDYEVRWKDGPHLQGLVGRPVRVRVTMRNTKLYALQFAA
jgi:hypothetical protein